MKRIFHRLKNKYLIALLIFLVWMLFFDKNDMISQYAYSTKVKKLKEERDFYLKQTAEVKKDLNELDSNLNSIEKFAREKYFMKKDNEDVFVIVKKNSNEKD